MNDEPHKPEVSHGVIVAWAVIAVFFFSWYVMAQSRYDPTLSAAILTSIVAIIVGTIGAAWGARATRRATELAHWNNLELQRQEQREQIRGLVQGLYAEMKIARELYMIQFQEPIENLKPDGYIVYWPIGQDYFTIYNNSSGMVGLISDYQVRTAIISAYMLSKGLIDTHLHNNRLVAKYDELNRVGVDGIGRTNSIQLRAALEELTSYSQTLKQNYEEAKKAVSEALYLIENSDYFTGKDKLTDKNLEKLKELN